MTDIQDLAAANLAATPNGDSPLPSIAPSQNSSDIHACAAGGTPLDPDQCTADTHGYRVGVEPSAADQPPFDAQRLGVGGISSLPIDQERPDAQDFLVDWEGSSAGGIDHSLTARTRRIAGSEPGDPSNNDPQQKERTRESTPAR